MDKIQTANPAIGGALGHYKGEDITFTADIWETKTYRNLNAIGRGMVANLPGVVVVHLVQDYDINGNKVYCSVNLTPGFNFTILASFQRTILPR
jgi:hypothetical protein